MRFQVSKAEIKKAQAPHNLFISGLFLFDLLMTPAVIVLNIGMAGLLVPLACSGTLIGYLYLRSRKAASWFVGAHWRLAYSRGLWLLTGYAISAAMIFAAWLLSLTARDASMEHILWTAFTRVALMPTLIAVMVTAMMEFGTATLAAKGEVPDKIVKAFPHPMQ